MSASASVAGRPASRGPTNHRQYVGSIADLGTDRRPGAFGSCMSDDQVFEVSCATPHHKEFLATLFSVIGTEGGPTATADMPASLKATLDAQCQEIAARLTQNPDPTYDSRLAVVVDSTVPVSDAARRQGASLLFYSICMVVSDPVPLTGSVVGLGEGPVPTG